MIISPKHEFLFVYIPKCAGTSVRQQLRGCDPLERFGSALRHVLWRYEEQRMTLISSEELRGRTLDMIERIAVEIDALSVSFIFFARQESFIFDEGRQIVDHLIPVDLRFKRLSGMACRVNGFLRTRLPLGLHTRIRKAALPIYRAVSARRGDLEAGLASGQLSAVADMLRPELAAS